MLTHKVAWSVHPCLKPDRLGLATLAMQQTRNGQVVAWQYGSMAAGGCVVSRHQPCARTGSRTRLHNNLNRVYCMCPVC